MAPLTPVPTLDAIAADPGLTRGLSRSTLVDLSTKALMAHSAILVGLMITPDDDGGPDQMLTIAQLAKLMGVSRNYVSAHKHQWPFTVAGAGLPPRFSARGYEKWVAEQTAGGYTSPRAQAQKGR